MDGFKKYPLSFKEKMKSEEPAQHPGKEDQEFVFECVKFEKPLGSTSTDVNLAVGCMKMKQNREAVAFPTFDPGLFIYFSRQAAGLVQMCAYVFS